MRSTLLKWKRSLESQLAEIDGAAAEEFAAAEYRDPFDTDLLREDQTLDATMRGIATRYPGRPLIAYGSRIAGSADPHSDIDMLALEYDGNAAPIQETVTVRGVEVDLTRVGINALIKGIKGRSRNNNNWFLSALRQCCIYGDRDGDARRLRSLAVSVWEQGPPALTPRQLRLGRGALLRLQDSTKKLVARAGDSSEAAKLARMRCDQLVTHSIYQFYCARRRWTTSLHRLLRSCRSDFPEFYALWLEYVRSEGAAEAFGVAKHMVEAVHEGVFPAAIARADSGEPASPPSSFSPQPPQNTPQILLANLHKITHIRRTMVP